MLQNAGLLSELGMKSLHFGKSPKLNDKLFRPGTVVGSGICLAFLAPLGRPDENISQLDDWLRENYLFSPFFVLLATTLEMSLELALGLESVVL
jgi:hypothetical protein